VLVSWRPVRDLAHSYWRRGDTGWATNLAGFVRRLAQLRVPYQAIRFGDLIETPRPTLEALYASIGGSYHPGQERFWEGTYHTLFGAATTRSHLGAPAELSRPQLPTEFLEYWDQLPPETLDALADMEARVLAGAAAGATPPRIPPAWYFKSRAMSISDAVTLRLRTRRN
jgi:hypothetical protein